MPSINATLDCAKKPLSCQVFRRQLEHCLRAQATTNQHNFVSAWPAHKRQRTKKAHQQAKKVSKSKPTSAQTTIN